MIKSPLRDKKSNKNQELLSRDLTKNLEILKERFIADKNDGFKVRDIYINPLNINGIIIYLDGTVNADLIEEHIIEPLLNTILPENMVNNSLQTIVKQILTTSSIIITNNYKEIINDILSGSTVLLIERESNAIVMNSAGFESRSIPEPKNEHVLVGPREAFVESLAKNHSMIRKYYRDENLINEKLSVGKKATKKVSLFYVADLVNPDLVEQVKKRIKEINVDSIQELSILAQHIEERPYSILTSYLLTERPDRATSFLKEGHILIFMESSPLGLIVPITFWSLFHTPDDIYHRWLYGNFSRLIRTFAILIALFTPAIYIAASNYHAEMIPTDLLLAIGATRETVPFPAIVEVLLMELSFELLREAGVRIPTPIGPTIGIVGALILGQAAVEANIVSPIMVIVVAITGLSSFAIPEITFSYTVRLARFGFLIAGAILGFFGISLLFIASISYLVSFKSFGVPFLSPLAPHYRSSKDLMLRPPVWKQWLRPFNLMPQDKKRGEKPEGSNNQ